MACKPRQCGACRVCCIAPNVPELSKPAYTACEHLVPLRRKGGCGNYENRPSACSAFKCAWLERALPDGYRPDQCGVLVWGGPPTEWGQALFALESQPGGFEQADAMLRGLAQTHVVVCTLRTGELVALAPNHLRDAAKKIIEKSLEKTQTPESGPV